MVMEMNLLLIGVIGLILVYVLSSRRTRRKYSIYLYILMMALIYYALFVARDPFELPSFVNDIIAYAIIVGSLVGFYRQIEGSLRADFNTRLESLRTDLNTRLKELKDDLRRDIDRIEKRMDLIDYKKSKQ